MEKQPKAERQEQAREQTMLTALERELSVFIRRAFRSIWREEGEEGTLGRWTYALLMRLSEDGPQRVGEVARRFGIDKSTASRHLARLEEMGLVEAVADERDARSALLRVTTQGEQCLARDRLARMRPVRRVFASWTEEDRAELTRLLARLNAELDQFGDAREP